MKPYWNGCDDPPVEYHFDSNFNMEEEIYKGVEHLKGVKAPDIPMVKNIQEETNRQVKELWDNFSK